MDNLKDGRESTKQEWLKMLRSGKILQCDKITSFMTNPQDEELKRESKDAFEVGSGARRDWTRAAPQTQVPVSFVSGGSSLEAQSFGAPRGQSSFGTPHGQSSFGTAPAQSSGWGSTPLSTIGSSGGFGSRPDAVAGLTSALRGVSVSSALRHSPPLSASRDFQGRGQFGAAQYDTPAYAGSVFGGNRVGFYS